MENRTSHALQQFSRSQTEIELCYLPLRLFPEEEPPSVELEVDCF